MPQLLALDWATAFNSLSAEEFLLALRRFQKPQPFVDMVAAIYDGRISCVNAGVSEEHKQGSEFCQGCPLSRLLCAVIIMTILLESS